MADYQGLNEHAEIGRRLYAALGEIDPDDWPALFGRGGIRGASYLGTAYSAARLEQSCLAERADKRVVRLVQIDSSEQRLLESADRGADSTI